MRFWINNKINKCCDYSEFQSSFCAFIPLPFPTNITMRYCELYALYTFVTLFEKLEDVFTSLYMGFG